MAVSCVKCDHFVSFKVKKDFYAIHCERYAFPEKIDNKDVLKETAKKCRFYEVDGKRLDKKSRNK